MSEQQNLGVVRRGYEAFGHGDLETLLSLFDEQIEWITPGPPELAVSGRRKGKQEVAQFFGMIGDGFEIQSFEPREFVAQGDLVVVLGHEVDRVKSTGRICEFDWAHVFRLRNEKVVSFQEYSDTSAVVAALSPTPASVRTEP